MAPSYRAVWAYIRLFRQPRRIHLNYCSAEKLGHARFGALHEPFCSSLWPYILVRTMVILHSIRYVVFFLIVNSSSVSRYTLQERLDTESCVIGSTSSLQARQYELQLQREHCAPQYDKPKVITHETFTAGLADRASASALPSCVSSISAVLIVASLQKAFATVAALRTSCQSSRTFS